MPFTIIVPFSDCELTVGKTVLNLSLMLRLALQSAATNMSLSSSAQSTALDKRNLSLPVEIQLKIVDHYLENLIQGNGSLRANIDN